MLTEKQIKNSAACKRWRESHKEYDQERQKRYIAENREKVNLRNKRYRNNNPDKAIEFRQRHRLKAGLIGEMLYGAKRRAKLKGIEFNLDASDIIIPDVCPVFGTKLEKSPTRLHWAHSPTLDRKDNSKGYVKGNVCVISHRANTIKGNANIEELEAVLKYMKS